MEVETGLTNPVLDLEHIHSNFKVGLTKTLMTNLASRLVRNQGIFAAGSFFLLFVANF